MKSKNVGTLSIGEEEAARLRAIFQRKKKGVDTRGRIRFGIIDSGS